MIIVEFAHFILLMKRVYLIIALLLASVRKLLFTSAYRSYGCLYRCHLSSCECVKVAGLLYNKSVSKIFKQFTDSTRIDGFCFGYLTYPKSADYLSYNLL